MCDSYLYLKDLGVVGEFRRALNLPIILSTYPLINTNELYELFKGDQNFQGIERASTDLNQNTQGSNSAVAPKAGADPQH